MDSRDAAKRASMIVGVKRGCIRFARQPGNAPRFWRRGRVATAIRSASLIPGLSFLASFLPFLHGQNSR